MDRRLQAQENALNSFQENIQPGRLDGLLLYFTGTNATATPGDLDDLGTVVIKRGGNTIVNRPIGVFGDMANIRGGSNRFSSTGSGDFIATVFIPFFALGLPQAYNIKSVSELNFDWQPKSTISTTFSSLTLSVYSRVAFHDEHYLYHILGDDQTPAAAVSARPYQLNKSNITEVYLRDPDTVLDSVALRSNNFQFTDQPKEVLVAGTLLDNMLEVDNFDMIQLQCYTLGKPLSALNKDSVIELTTSGTGTIEITVCHLIPKKGAYNPAAWN